MAHIFKEEDRESNAGGITLADRVRQLEKEKLLSQMEAQTVKGTKKFRWPWKWRNKFNRSKKLPSEQMLVIYFNKKNEIEAPRYMPIFDGNMIVWKNKPYEFDPRAIWRIKGVKHQPLVYCIREIDRRPIKNPDGDYKRDRLGRIIYGKNAAVSNLDLDDIRARGDSTESDEFLIKAALKAQTSQIKGKMNMVIIVIAILAVVGLVIWFLSSK